MRCSRALALCGVVVVMLVLPGCTSGSTPDAEPSGGTSSCGPGDRIGIALSVPGAEDQVLPKNVFDEEISNSGFQPDVRFADPGDPQSQQQQIEDMLAQGAKILVIAAPAGAQIDDALARAQREGIQVIAYQQPINSPDVDYLVGYDGFRVGQLQAASLLEGMTAVKGAQPTYGVELFAGDGNDVIAKLLFNGAMDTLQPKIDDGAVTVRSGQTSFDLVATSDWDPKLAQQRMANLIGSYYKGGATLDGVLAPDDQIAGGILTASAAASLAPVVTGAGADTAAVQRIAAGQQYSTVFEDPVALASQTIGMVKQLCSGESATTNAIFTWPDSELKIPANYLEPVVVTRQNAPEVFANNPALLAAFQPAG